MKMKTKQLIQLLLAGTMFMMLALAGCSKDNDIPFDEDYDGPDLGLAYTKVTLSADKGELEVEITAGSESYSVESGSKSIVSASVSGNKIKLKAGKAGSAKVAVTDKKSGDKKTIDVEVISKEDFHSAILMSYYWESEKISYSTDGGKTFTDYTGIPLFIRVLEDKKRIGKAGESYDDYKYNLVGNKITYPDLKDAYTIIYYVKKDEVLHLNDVFDNGGFIQRIEYKKDDGRG